MWLSCSPLSRLLLFSWAWMWMASRIFLFHMLGLVSFTFAPSQSTWCCASHGMCGLRFHCWYPLASPPACVQLSSSSMFFLSLLCVAYHTLCRGSPTLLLSSWGQGWESSLRPRILWGCWVTWKLFWCQGVCTSSGFLLKGLNLTYGSSRSNHSPTQNLPDLGHASPLCAMHQDLWPCSW